MTDKVTVASDWMAGCAMIYLALFGTGKILFGETRLGLGLLALATLAGHPHRSEPGIVERGAGCGERALIEVAGKRAHGLEKLRARDDEAEIGAREGERMKHEHA